jgi:NitT/TauT family transport system substrate-binding protein
MSLMLSQAVCVLGVSAADSLPVVRVATLKYGTANWELQVIKAHGLDRAHGFELDIREVNSPSAASIALQGGAADVAVQDWLWVLRQQDQGRQFLFAPYSTAVGRLVVPKGSSIDSLQALAGKRLGVAGGDSDKSWRLLNELITQPDQPTMADSIKPRFGAPPLLNQLALRGDIDALLTYWHYAARLESEGFRTLLTVDELLAELGIVGPVPMLGWCFSAGAVQGNGPPIARFLAAAAAARQRMAEDANVWLSLKPLMRVTSPAVFEALKAGFLAGAPGPVTASTIQDTTAVAALYLNDKALAERMVPGIFWPPVQ